MKQLKNKILNNELNNNKRKVTFETAFCYAFNGSRVRIRI